MRKKYGYTYYTLSDPMDMYEFVNLYVDVDLYPIVRAYYDVFINYVLDENTTKVEMDMALRKLTGVIRVNYKNVHKHCIKNYLNEYYYREL